MIVQYHRRYKFWNQFTGTPLYRGSEDSTYPHIGTCRKAKNKNFEFCFDCDKNVLQWTKKNHLGHFDWNCLGSWYSIRPNTQNMAILAENRRLRLKVMLRGPKLWVNLISNVIGIRLRFIGTHFDHNRYIIRIFIFWFSVGLYGAMQKFRTPYRGGSRIYFSLIIILTCCY